VDSEVLAQGINTPLVIAGFILARLTHAPNVRFASAIGQSICDDWSPLVVANAEAMWLDKGLLNVGFAVAAAELLPKYNPKEFFRPAQVDSIGNTNNIAFGREVLRGGKSRMRLPGSGGIPDVTAYSEHIYLYVPRHSPAIFVEKVDVVSGVGHTADRTRGRGPVYLISYLGQFDWRNGRMRLTHLHPGVTLEQVQKKTGFRLEVAPDLSETVPPTSHELRLLREQIDPLGVRKLETLGGAARKALLQSILEAEGAY
jgi:acyl CoA:acetate/3-ketoacid CoA transferase beta subunit